MLNITKTDPQLFDRFIDIIASFQPCTVEQIRHAMRGGWGPVYSARNFALEYGFISEQDKKFTLTLQGERLIRFSGNLRKEFLINNVKLQCNEPFLSVSSELEKKKS